MKFYLSILLSLCLNSLVSAAPILTVHGTLTHTLNLPSDGANSTPTNKTIKLLKLSLTNKARDAIKMHARTALQDLQSGQSTNKPDIKLPAKIDLGMNHVPVLNQGAHGTCVTFAVSAALDALLGQGDYISQLCHLTLGQYIKNNSTERPSGWDGSDANTTLSRFIEYGIVSKDTEQTDGCGGLHNYPSDDLDDPKNEMSLVAYHAASQKSTPFYEYSDYMIHNSLLDFNSAIMKKSDMKSIENAVKTSLYQGNRVLIAALLPISDSLGLDAKHNQAHDTWALTGRTAYLAESALSIYALLGQWGGHEMIITGYDDSAKVVDSDGISHKGLFTLRNSWGTDVGDNGNFYMTYDYFRALTVDLISIGNLNP